MDFATKLRTLRRQRGLSPEDLARALDVPAQDVFAWESGQADPETKVLVRISQILEVSLDSLLSEDDIDPRETARATPTPSGSNQASGQAAQQPKAPPYDPDALWVTDEMIRGYLAEKRHKAMTTAIGVGLIIASLCFVFTMHNVGGALMFLVCAAIGVAVLVFSSFTPKAYKEVGRSALRFDPDMHADFCGFAINKRAQFGQLIAMGVMLLVMSLGLLIGAGVMGAFFSRALLALVPMAWAVAVGMFIYAGINMGALDTITRPAGTHKPRKGDKNDILIQVQGKGGATRRFKAGQLYSLLMPASVFVFLLIGFVFGVWHPTWILIPGTAILLNSLRAVQNRPAVGYGWLAGAFVPLSVVAYLLIGSLFNMWHPGWMIIPGTAFLCSAFAAWKASEHA